ncbi:MAG: hypothetical protein ABSA64_01470 [Sedimentisphaerales bacterium]|jgi:hypothetical protein
MQNNSLAKWNKDTSNVLKDTLACLAEGLTGIAASERKELALSVGHIFQSLRKGQFLSRLLEEWNAYKDKGRIKEDYLGTEQHQACLQELLTSLDKDCPDEIRFQTLKKIFLVAATEKASDRNSLLPYQFLRLCREMTSGEIIVLQAAYKIAKKAKIPNGVGTGLWLRMVADESGLTHTSLVEIHEEQLMKKYLLTGRLYADRSGVDINPHFRLTELAYGFCEFIANYAQTHDSDSKAAKDTTT